MLEQKNIGIIGYGHLGKSIERALIQKGIQVRSSNGPRENRATQNAEIAKWADLLLLTVRPTQIDEVIAQIYGKIKDNAEVISLAAAYPQRDLETKLQAPVARAMLDIEGMGSILYQGDEEQLELMNRLSLYPTVIAKREQEVDDYTVGEACLPGKAAWHFAENRGNAEAWLQGYLDFLEKEKGLDRRVTQGIVDAVRQEGNYSEKLKTVATGKGITATMIGRLKEGERLYQEIYGAGQRRIAEMVEELQRKK